MPEPDRREWIVLAIAFAVAAALVASRRPDALTNPQFYFEDGTWYAEAHESGGWRVLFETYRGYFVLVQRLGGWIAQAVPLRHAPLAMNLVALAVEALPAVLLCSSRFAALVPDLRVRILLALLCLGLPNTWSTITNVTHAQWHLALLALLVVVARPSRHVAWRAFDVAALALSGLSGPFALFLAPAALVAWRRDRDRWRLVQLLTVAATAAAQAAALALTGGAEGTRPPLGASVLSFFGVWTRQVVYGFFAGQRGHEWIVSGPDPALLQPAALVGFGLAGLAILAAGLARGPFELRVVVVVALAVFAAAAVWPAPAPTPIPYWQDLQHPGTGNRYYLLLMFAIAATLVWMLARKGLAWRVPAAAALALFAALGLRLDWRQPPLRDYGFPAFAARYERAAPGERVQVQHPPGWGIILTRR